MTGEIPEHSDGPGVGRSLLAQTEKVVGSMLPGVSETDLLAVWIALGR